MNPLRCVPFTLRLALVLLLELLLWKLIWLLPLPVLELRLLLLAP